MLSNYVTTFSIIPCILPFSPTPMTQHPLVHHPKTFVMGKFGMNLHFYPKGFHVVFHLLAPYSSPIHSHILTSYLLPTQDLNTTTPTYPLCLPLFFSSPPPWLVLLSSCLLVLWSCSIIVGGGCNIPIAIIFITSKLP
jgi:hypothetical protein